jgi:quinol monooxygenase YgiN
MIAHNVYFTLHDNSAAARQSLLDACNKYLAVQPGILSFHCGVLAADHVRPVNDRDFDVGLHVIFKDNAAHDQYQASPGHDQFVAETKENWKKARVFDTVVE